MKQTAVLVALVLIAASAVLVPPSPAPGEIDPAGGEPKFPKAPPNARITDKGWFVPAKRGADRPALPKEVIAAFVIPVHGPISTTAYEIIKRKADRCVRRGARIIIFDMDTPGGRSDAMYKIVRLIIEDLADVYTVAYVNPNAYSAGAIISLACDEIVLSPTAKLGDAMPIMIEPPGKIVAIPEKERGKIESAATAEVRVLANRGGYSVLLCEAMITITMEVWLVRDPQTSELRFVLASKYRGRVKGAPGKADEKAGPAKKDARWHYVDTIVGPNKLVTMTAKEAVFLGFSEHIFASMDDLKRHYNIAAEPAVMKDTWSEAMVDFLTTPQVAGLLMMVGLICIYMEIKTPGFGVAGAIGILCFAILFGGRYLIGMANWWEIALFVLGLALLTMELFVTPGFGVFGMAGIGCCVFGLLAIFVRNAPTELPFPDTREAWRIFQQGVFWLCAGFVGGVVGAAVLTKFLPKIPIANRLILAPAQAAAGPPVSGSSHITRVRAGDLGVVEGMCRPVGKARFGEDIFDAVSEGAAIEAGSKVRVLRREGNRLIIEKVQE